MVAGVRSVPSVSSLGERVRGLFQREPKTVTPKTILIVEGNANHRQATARLVQSLGYEAVQSAGLNQAMGLLAEQDPEFVLLGFELDDASGLDALAQIHDLDNSLEIIMLAPNVWDTRVAEAMRKGAIAYLARPFGADDLRELFGRR
jgi:two-component system response regulator RegA